MASFIEKEKLKKMVLDLAQDKISHYASKKGAYKYFVGNVDKVISKNVINYKTSANVKKIYSRTLMKCSNQTNINKIYRIIKSENLFRSKEELLKFAKHLGIKINGKIYYNNLLREISNHIYKNRKNYQKRYVLYRNEKEECVLEAEELCNELIESFKLKTKKDMINIAKLLNIDVKEENTAEDIRKKIIYNIVRHKINK